MKTIARRLVAATSVLGFTFAAVVQAETVPTPPPAAPTTAKIDCSKDGEKANVECKKAAVPATKTEPGKGQQPGQQSGHPPRPANLELLEEALPPPNILNDKEAPPRDEITVRKSGDDTITEYRIRGRLYKQKVQPQGGPAYILIDEKGEGKFSRVDGPDIKLSVPMWVLWTW